MERGPRNFRPDGSERSDSTRATRAKELLVSTKEALIVIDEIEGVPGVSYDVSVVRNRQFPGLGGWRHLELPVLKRTFMEARSRNRPYVENIMRDRDVPNEDAAAAVLEAWQLGGDMALKYAGMADVFEETIRNHPHVYPQEIQDRPAPWITASEMFGGLKSTLVITDLADYKGMTPEERKSLNKQHAQHINRLNELSPDKTSIHYYTAPDMKSHSEDMDEIANFTDFVASQSEPVGTGNPSPYTAAGVEYGLRGLTRSMGIPEHQRLYAIQGAAGEVGSVLVRLIREGQPRAGIYVTDLLEFDDKKRKVEELADRFGAEVVDPDQIYTEGNIFVPSAIGGQLTEERMYKMRKNGVEAIGGGANYLWPAGTEDQLPERYLRNGLFVAPAPLLNKGGIQSILPQFIERQTGHRPSQDVAYQSVADTEYGVISIFDEARHRQGERVSMDRVFRERTYKRMGVAFEQRGLFAA